MRIKPNTIRLFALQSVILLLASCGGGGGATAPAAVATTTPPAVTGTPPAAATQVLASDNTSTAYVQVKWYSPDTALTFNIYRAATAQGAQSLLAPNINSRIYNDTSAVAGTPYYYWVEAVNANALKSAKAGGDIGTRAVAPVTPQLLPPLNVQASDSSSSTGINVTWDASVGAVSYFVYRATSATTAANLRVFLGIVNAPVVTFTDNAAALTAGTTYWYWVRAVAGQRFVDSQPDTGIKLAVNPVMVPPASVVASAYPGEIQVNWDAVPGAVTYELHRKDLFANATPMPVQAGLTVTSFADSTVAAGNPYYYSVIAVDANGVKSPLSTDSNRAFAQAGQIAAPSQPGDPLPIAPVNSADVVTVYATSDNQVVFDTYDLNNNLFFDKSTLSVGCNFLQGGAFSSAICFRSLLYFDLPMISGKTINSATLKMTAFTPGIDAFAPINAHPITSIWGSNVSWNTLPQGLQDPEGFAVPPTAVNPVMNMNVTAIVRQWAAGMSNFGLFLHDHSATMIGSANFEATEFYSTERYYNQSQRPQLIIDYQ